MRILVTGGTGFVGTHIVLALLEAGHEVTVLARDPERMPPALRSRVRMVRGALEQIDARGQDVCIHNAVVWRDADDEFGLDDVHAATRVFLAAAEAGVEHLVYTSSTAVQRPFAPGMNEAQRLTPTDFYAAAKAANEAFLSAVSWQSKMRVTVLRPGPVLGGPAVPGARTVVFRRIAELLHKAREGTELEVTKNDGRQFITAQALAQVYVRALVSQGNRNTYVVVSKDVVLWEELAQMVLRATHSRSALVVRAPDAAQEPPHWFDVRKLTEDFGLTFLMREAIEAEVFRLAER